MMYYVGIDVGGTSIKMGLFKENDELIDKVSFSTRTVEYLVDDIYTNIKELSKFSLKLLHPEYKWVL